MMLLYALGPSSGIWCFSKRMGADVFFYVQTLGDLFSDFSRSGNKQEMTVGVEQLSLDCVFF